MSSVLEKYLTPTALRIRKSPIRLIMQRAAKIEGEVTKFGGGQPQSSLVRSLRKISINSTILTRIIFSFRSNTTRRSKFQSKKERSLRRRSTRRWHWITTVRHTIKAYLVFQSGFQTTWKSITREETPTTTTKFASRAVQPIRWTNVSSCWVSPEMWYSQVNTPTREFLWIRRLRVEWSSPLQWTRTVWFRNLWIRLVKGFVMLEKLFV